MMETIIAKHLRDAAETYILFFNSQMEARSNRFIEIILEFLTTQIYIT